MLANQDQQLRVGLNCRSMIPENLKGRFDPVYAAWLEASNPPMPPGFQPTVAQMRQGFIAQSNTSNGPLDPGLRTSEHRIPGREGHLIGARLYQHRDATGPQPTCVFIHGGGWVLGDLNTHHGVCNDLAIATGTSVLAIDYRLSPEHVYPKALHDVEDVLVHLEGHAEALSIDASRVALFADSAGASLAIAAVMRRRMKTLQPKALVLAYPGLGADIDRPSFVEMRDLPGLTPELMRFFFMSYIGGEILPDPYAAPLTVEDKRGLPAIYISAAELDPLRDDATELAEQLEAADVEVTLRIEMGLGHGYLWLRNQTQPARNAFSQMTSFIAEQLD